eukprot:TRINITY_DN14999_c0_g1::TRINITY_DN14999_c0_g1_i1::g.25742::m.25742 TRINITY_DN14999_c0_g1::TRINITY_DN14999_c0_g1_i1::g.25742  ORF type:complete len:1023 (-),score=353.00,sp/F4IRR2/SAD2_ARATH/31.33/9e-160,IBN_N/PF03810.14/3.5e-13,IBN_N/PF03810.14/6.6e+02,Cse1/PF08506.5/5.1e-13,HEAT_2/PF13646.1/3.4e+03,HEAT_2/PF13646.1/3.4e+02,HEAT_2/PF13646.1/0.024,HEAT_2/PF13646.1/3.3e+02,HEAT_2/PF13646.1/1.2e+04,Xpo1/PF08389.7/0.0034,Xpo1/PF08389.7/1.2e+03,Xpo1/PF08389.7/5.7e+03,Xpo1/PF08389.7/1.2e+04,Xpo1/PF0838
MADEAGVQHLCLVLQQTLNQEPQIRKHAEEELKAYETTPGYMVALFRLVMSTTISADIRLAGIIYFKNVVMRMWHEGNILSAQEKTLVRDNLVEAIIFTDQQRIRAQLCQILNKIAQLDFPEQWSGLMDQVMRNISSDDFKRISGGVMALLHVFKRYEYKPPTERAAVNQIVQMTFPPLLHILKQLFTNPTNESFELQKTVLKCFWAATHQSLPTLIYNDEHMNDWMNAFGYILETPADPKLTSGADEVDASPVWKTKKWAAQIIHRMFQRWGNPRHLSKDEKKFSKMFSAHWATNCLQLFFRLMLNRPNCYVSPRVSNISMNYICTAAELADTWKWLKDQVQPLIVDIIFPLLAWTQEDEDLWNEDPVEYVRKSFDIIEDFYSPRASAMNTLATLVKKHQKESLGIYLQYIAGVLTEYSRCPPETRNYRLKDGVFISIGTLNRALLKAESFVTHMPALFEQHILPEFSSHLGFLRARACWLVGYFHDRLPQHLFHQSLAACLGLLRDAQLPVRVQAALAVSSFIDDDKSIDLIRPLLGQLLENLFQLMDDVDNENIISTLEKIVEKHETDVAPYAYNITARLADTYTRLITDADEEDDYMLSAAECLSAMDTLLQAVSKKPEIFVTLQPLVIPLLEQSMNEANDFFEDVLDLTTTLTYCAPVLTPDIWRLFPAIYKAFEQAICTEDSWTSVMLGPLDNFISRSTDVFLGSKDPNYLAMIFNICKQIFDTPESNERCYYNGCKLIEVILLWCRGRVDDLVEPFLFMTFTALQKAKTSALRVVLCETVLNALYYNPTLTLSLTEKHSATAQFFNLLLSLPDEMRRIYDKKLCIIALMEMLKQPLSSLPASVQTLMPQIFNMLVILLASIDSQRKEEAEERDEDGVSDDDSAPSDVGDDDDPNPNGIEDDDDDGDFNGGGNFNFIDEIDELDLEDEDDTLFQTPLDDIDEFIQFGELMKEVAQRESTHYNALLTAMPADSQRTLSAVLQLAERKKQEAIAAANQPQPTA